MSQPQKTFNKKTSAEEVSAGIDLSGKNAIVTGANTGIGEETARVLALRGAKVIMACRHLKKAEAARARILESVGDQVPAENIEVMLLDLNSLAGVRHFAEEFIALDRPLHLLINNAGIMISERRETCDGFESHYGVNYISHFLLTNLLIDSLRAAKGARVVCVSSSAMIFSKMTEAFEDLNWKNRKYKGMESYGDSKLMNAMFSFELNKRYVDEGIVSSYLHPGIIKTELGRDQNLIGKIMGIVFLPFMRGIPQGAATSVMVATAPEYALRGGLYFGECSEWELAKPLAADERACKTLWDQTEKLVGLS
jgi:retinol dehydrogenase-12